MPPPPSPGRAAVSLAITAAVSAYGAVVLGEYDLTGLTPLYAGGIFGLVIGEALLFVGKDTSRESAGAAGLVALAGMTWAVVLSTARALEFAELTSWFGVFLAATVASLWVRSAGWRGDRSRRGA